VGRGNGIELFTRLDHEGLCCQQCVGNQARERCTVDRGIGIMEVVRANVVSDVEVRLEPEDLPAVLSEGSEEEEEEEEEEQEMSESESEEVDLSCVICGSTDGDVYHYNLVDGRIVCEVCHDADDTLPGVRSVF